MRAVVKSVGGYLPKNIVDNHKLSERMDTSDEWITSRSGIKQRHIAATGELTSDMAVCAARKALDKVGDNATLTINDIDLIIVGTTTPDRTFPSTAAYVQTKLGSAHGVAFDVQAVCSGFVYGLSIASAMLETGQAKGALVIGAETLSRILDWEDRTTSVLFGDGAGAMVLQAEDVGADASHVIGHHIRTDGGLADLLYTDGGPSYNQQAGYVRMNGKEVFRHAVGNISDAILQMLAKTGYEVSDIDWFVPHQANYRIIDAVARRIGLPPEKTIITVAEHANTSAASIPLALAHAVETGKIRKGDLVMTEAMGGGLTWGANLIRW